MSRYSKTVKATLANGLWCLSLLGEARDFHRAVENTQATQAGILASLLKKHGATQFGQAHDFAKLSSPQDFQTAVPLSTYEDYAPLVSTIAEGEQNVLTGERVTLLEPTSGSASASKLIPYTPSLQKAFMRGVAPWVADLFSTDPKLLTGTAYWSISPVLQKDSYSAGGIPIGFEEDSAYLGPLGAWLSRGVMAVPSDVRLIKDTDTFRYVTLFLLLQRPDLRLVSVWNPTFLTLLLKPLESLGEQLADDIAKGKLSVELEPDLKVRLERHITPSPRRAETVRQALTSDFPTQALWPKLRLLSCWTDANAAPFAQDLQCLFPHASLQGKGLISTEAFVSFPLTACEAPALAIRSHFFEFVDDVGGVHLAHEIESGQSYSVVASTDGLYRYQLFDRVEVVGFYETCPLIRFIGKEALVSDHFGEKVNALHVDELLQALLETFQIHASFTLLSCEAYGERFAYTLFLETAHTLPESLARDLDNALQENVHYAYCRRLGQLGEAKILRVERGLETYLQHAQTLGQRLGDIKPQNLSPKTDWSEVFRSISETR